MRDDPLFRQDLDQFTIQWRRRSFLRGSLLLAGAAGVGLTLGCSPAETSATNAVAPHLTKVLARLKPVALPEHPPLFSPQQSAMDKNLSSMLAVMDSQILQDLDMAASLFEYGATLLGWHFSKFTSLDDTQALAYVERWQNGGGIQRGIITTFKKLLYVAYWRDRSTWAAVEFDGPVSEKWGLPSLGNAPLPVDVTATT